MPIDTTKFKNLLEKELKTLEGELLSIGQRSPSNPNDWEAKPNKLNADNADDMEVAESIDEFEDNAGILRQLEIQYNDVKHALAKIDLGTYGICENNGHEIELARLEASPSAKNCIKHMK
jgi:RNA polymerase-binding transcription factor DksA